jgi:hypothetical protein
VAGGASSLLQPGVDGQTPRRVVRDACGRHPGGAHGTITTVSRPGNPLLHHAPGRYPFPHYSSRKLPHRSGGDFAAEQEPTALLRIPMVSQVVPANTCAASMLTGQGVRVHRYTQPKPRHHNLRRASPSSTDFEAALPINTRRANAMAAASSSQLGLPNRCACR